MVIYETINLINGKRYIGKDFYNDPNYLGSGRILKLAIKKYGRENFSKVIIEICDDSEHLNIREKFWIRRMHACESKMYYNIGAGGDGGDNITYNPHRNDFIQKMTDINSRNNGMCGKKHTDDAKKKQSVSAIGRYTLEWFIERYGDSGRDMYEARNTRLSTTRTGDKNSAYVHVDERVLTDLIMNTSLNHIQLCAELSVSKTLLYAKYRMYYDCKSLKAVREKLLGVGAGWDGRSRRKLSYK